MSERRSGDLALVRWLFADTKGFRLHLALLTLLSLLIAPLTLLIPLPIKIAIDNVLGNQPLPFFLAWAVPESVADSKRGVIFIGVGLVIGIALLQQLLSASIALLRTYSTEYLVLRLRSRLFVHAQRLSFIYHDARGGHDTLYRIHNDATAVEGVLVEGVIPIVMSVATLAAMLGVTLSIDWQLTLVALLVAFPLALAVQVTRNRLRDNWSHAKTMESSVLGVLQEVLGSLRVVQAYGQEQREAERFGVTSQEMIRVKLKAVLTECTFGIVVGLVIGVGMGAVLYLGISHVQSGKLSLGNLILVAFYLAMVYQPLETVGLKMTAVQSALASADRAYSFLNTAPEVASPANPRRIERAEGAVQFLDVSYSYNQDRRILHDINLEVPQGCRVGLVGSTGAGKTTLVSLLMRFFDPTAGKVLLDGVDLREYGLEDLRRQFAIVLQDSVLFSASIAENIAYGRPDASEEEIIEAARSANAHDFISRLPDGYRSQVGERGMGLSGGERQRVALARAFLRDAPILILDEPTSSVDLETESLIIEAIGRLIKGRTSFMISHRPSTLDACDMVVSLEAGRIKQVSEQQAVGSTSN